MAASKSQQWNICFIGVRIVPLAETKCFAFNEAVYERVGVADVVQVRQLCKACM